MRKSNLKLRRALIASAGLVCGVFGLLRCGGSLEGTCMAVDHVRVRSVTFSSHLQGKVKDDPVVRVGETVLVVPAPEEPFALKTPVRVQLPRTTP